MPADVDETARLFEEIIAHPESEEARVVYADHLIELGDPRGDFISLQCRAERLDADDAERAALFEQARDLLAHHETAWTEDIRALGIDTDMTQLTFRRGYVERAWLAAAKVPAQLPPLRARTPIRDLRVSVRDADTLRSVWQHAMTVERVGITILGPREAGEAIEAAVATLPHDGAIRALDASTAAIVTSLVDSPRARGLEELRSTGLPAASIAKLASCAHLDTLRELHVARARLTADVIDVLARSPTLAQLHALDVEGCNLTTAMLDALLGAAFAPRLRLLRLANNALGSTGQLGRIATSLEVLDLDGARLTDRAIAELLASPAAERLRRLDLSRNQTEDAGFASAIASARLPALRGLVADHSNASIETARALAESSLDELRWLDLHDNALGDDAISALARSTRLPNLWKLQLSSCDIGKGGCAALGASELGARLRELDLSRNRIDDDALVALLAPDRLDSLEVLSLEGNAIELAGVESLGRSSLSRRLRALSISNLPADAARALVSLELPELRSLYLDRVDDDLVDVLVRSNKMPALRELSLRANELTDDGAETLARAGLPHVLWLELFAPRLSDIGRAELRRTYGHHAMVLDQAMLRDFAMLGRTI